MKGVAFRTIELCFFELRGADAREEARARMRPELANLYRDGLVLAATWYPISWYRETFQAFRAATGEGNELVRAIGKCAARHDMSGVHKQLLAKIISPQMLLAIAQRVFKTYYDTGTMEVVSSRRGFAHVRCVGCIGWDESMWVELAGSCEAQLELTGGKHVRLRILSGGGESDTGVELEAHWV